MRKSITKTNVIKALNKEDLVRGNFFQRESTKCAVCAVGAVLRHMSFEKWAIKLINRQGNIGDVATKNVYVNGSIRYLIKEKNYLGALSCYFEQGHTKKTCIKFVKRYFPKKLTIEIRKEDI